MSEQERRTVGEGYGSEKNSAGGSAGGEASSVANKALTKIPRWAAAGPLLMAYHMEKWGMSVRTEAGTYERLCLEAFQAGLLRLTALRKRGAFRRTFAEFDPEVAAEFGEKDVEQFLTNSAIIRNQVKIEAIIHNARATLTLRKSGGLPSLV